MISFSADQPLRLADQGCFFVAGNYGDSSDGRTMTGQMFVQYQIPAVQKFPHPLVMIHGGGQTGVNFLGTPDGRKGWADYFVANGYAVYVVDQPGRGRSGYFSHRYGPSAGRGADAVAQRFTAPENSNHWPQAGLHTQWPGDGVAGDPVFDQFYASQVESMTDMAALERFMREAGGALLDRIGSAVLITHSQSGPFGWTLADTRPKRVRGIVAAEPSGPPLYEIKFKGAPDYFEDDVIGRPWGITRGPITYAPPVSSVEELKLVRQDKADGPGLARGWLQSEPARQMPTLQGIPILIYTAEASYHAPYDHLTSKYLRQAGVAHDYVRLADVGLHGNGHMVMLEKNNLEIAAFMQQWMEAHIH